MATQENLQNFYEGLMQQQIEQEQAFADAILDVSNKYSGFLTSQEKQRIIFAADFVLWAVPDKIIMPHNPSIDFYYESFRLETQRIFITNRVSKDTTNIFEDSIDKVPPKATKNLREFRKEWSNGALQCDVQMEVLQGEGNPIHLLVMERYMARKRGEGDPVLKTIPFAEVWTVNKFEPKKPVNTNTSLIRYQSPPISEPVLRIIERGHRGFRDKR